VLQIVESTVDMVDLAKTTERALKSIKRHTSSGTNDNFWSEVHTTSVTAILYTTVYFVVLILLVQHMYCTALKLI
jgi:hypothetical protein